MAAGGSFPPPPPWFTPFAAYPGATRLAWSMPERKGVQRSPSFSSIVNSSWTCWGASFPSARFRSASKAARTWGSFSVSTRAASAPFQSPRERSFAPFALQVRRQVSAAFSRIRRSAWKRCFQAARRTSSPP